MTKIASPAPGTISCASANAPSAKSMFGYTSPSPPTSRSTSVDRRASRARRTGALHRREQRRARGSGPSYTECPNPGPAPRRAVARRPRPPHSCPPVTSREQRADRFRRAAVQRDHRPRRDPRTRGGTDRPTWTRRRARRASTPRARGRRAAPSHGRAPRRAPRVAANGDKPRPEPRRERSVATACAAPQTTRQALDQRRDEATAARGDRRLGADRCAADRTRRPRPR